MMAVKKEKTEKTAKVVKKTKTAKPKAEKVAKAVKIEKEVKAKIEKIMPKVEVVEKVVKETPSKAEKKVTEKYFYAIGRRKASIAQVRLFETDNATEADLIINGRKLKDYFPAILGQNNVLGPLKAVGIQGRMRMTAIVRGGGITGQVEAVRLGISRALVVYDETLKKTLKGSGFMTRDSRKVERKKPGLKKARKSPQWSKR